MSTGSTDGLVRLIQSLTKAEKRSFKLYANRNSSSSEELKFLKLFDFIEKNEDYTDENALKKLKDIKKVQLSNIKAHLYKQVLTSLRLQHAFHVPIMEIRELLDHALILYNKGFYHQALKVLEKAKINAQKIEAPHLQLEIVEFEKMIEHQYSTKDLPARVELLTAESVELKQLLAKTIRFSNLSLQLYSLYVRVGFVRNEKDFKFVQTFFNSQLPEFNISKLNRIERMHLYNAYVWYYYITQDFLKCYKYTRLWVDLFEQFPALQAQFKEMYVRGYYNLHNALFNLRSFDRLKATMEKMERLELGERDNDHIVLLHQLYVLTGKINQFYLEGRFAEGLQLVPEIIQFIENNTERLEKHRMMVLHYKIACLYFGSGDNRNTIKYLTKIIQTKDVSLREDIQCFARILNLIAHFELGNDEGLEYQIKSVYRFLSQMGDLHGVQKEILQFLRQLPFTDEKSLLRGFKILHTKLVKLSQQVYEQRPFLYLDIISWLECKIEQKTVQEVIRTKFELEQKTGERLYFPK